VRGVAFTRWNKRGIHTKPYPLRIQSESTNGLPLSVDGGAWRQWHDASDVRTDPKASVPTDKP